METVEYIEHNYLGGKHLTRDTAALIKSMANAYGNSALIHLLQDNNAFLLSKEFKNQGHFEATILLILRNNVPYLKKGYNTYMGELDYNMHDEPPELPEHDTRRKEVRDWIL